MSWTFRTLSQKLRSFKMPQWLTDNRRNTIKHLALQGVIACIWNRNGRTNQAVEDFKRQELAEADFRRQIDGARDLEFTRVRERQRCFVEEVPEEGREDAREWFKWEWGRLEREREEQRGGVKGEGGDIEEGEDMGEGGDSGSREVASPREAQLVAS